MPLKTVIYLDVLLLVNFLIAYLLLRCVAQLSGAVCGPWPCLAAAGLAAGCTLSLLAPDFGLVPGLAFKGISAALVCRIAFGFCGWRGLLRQTVWFFALNIGLAGLVLWAVQQQGAQGMHTNNFSVYLALSPTLILICTAGVYLVLRLALLAFGPPQNAPRLELQLTFAEQQPVTLTALLDTGFSLLDPVGGKPALLVCYESCRKAIPPEVQPFFAAFLEGRPSAPPPHTKLRLIPCQTAAGQRTLPALDGILVSLQRDSRRYTAPALVVFTDQPLADGTIQALVGQRFLHTLTQERSRTSCITPSLPK